MVSGLDHAFADSKAENKRKHLRDMGLPALFGAVVLLVSATLLLGVNVSALHDNLRRMEHSQRVLTKISDLEASILGDELTVRGYALTGDPRFVYYQQRERRKCVTARDELTRLMAAEPEHGDDYRRVLRDLTWHLDAFGKLSGAGAPVVAHAIVDPSIRLNMKTTRIGLAALRATEMQELGLRQREMTSQISRAFGLAVGIIIAAFVLGGLGIFASQIRLPLHR